MGKQDHHTNNDEDVLAQLRVKAQTFARTLLTHPDAKKAEKLIGDQAGTEFDRLYASEVEARTLENTEVEQHYGKSIDGIFSLEDQKHKTKAYTKVQAISEEPHASRTGFLQWDAKDQVTFCMAGLSAMIVLATSSANVYSNIMAGGDPVFLESPELAMLLAALLPCGSLTLKFIPDFLPHDRARALYIQIMYGMTALSLLAWVPLFANIFHGIAGGFSLNDFGETNPLSIALTAVQLLSELLVGATLFHVVTTIYSRYAPDAYRPNAEYIQLQSLLEEQLKDHEPLRMRRNETRARLVEIQAMRRAHINEQVAWYLDMRGRWNGEAS